MSTFQEVYDKYIQNQAPAMPEFERVMNACFDEFPTLKKVVFAGYTPSWNDGDPCTHRDDYLIFFGDVISGGGNWLWDQIYDNDYEDESNTLRLGHNNFVQIDLNPGTDLQKVIEGEIESSEVPKDKLQKLETLLSRFKVHRDIWRTNYLVEITRENGALKLKNSRYDCGY